MDREGTTTKAAAAARAADSHVLWEIPIAVARVDAWVDVSSVNEVFSPENKAKQLQLCDHVNLWSQNLAQTAAELLIWKDDAFALNALPLNMLSKLAIITSRLVRCKGEVLPPQHQALELARSYITGEVVDDEVEALKAALIEQSNELEMEKMRRIESERKLSAALAQVYRLRSDRKVFRWSRLSMQLELTNLSGKQKKARPALHEHTPPRALGFPRRLMLARERHLPDCRLLR